MRDREKILRMQLRLDILRVLDRLAWGTKEEARRHCEEAIEHVDELEELAQERADAAQ